MSWLSHLFNPSSLAAPSSRSAILAQADTGDSNPNFWDNEILNEWRIPFGDWADQAILWADNNLKWLLDAVEWPFRNLIREVVGGGTDGGSKESALGFALTEIYWVWVVLAITAIALLTRSVRVGAFVVVALIVCGLLGEDYWLETARTIGFISVAVVLCAVIGIPVGIACARVNGIWLAVRPLLDAMQVVHPFAYMLPFIFFWGIGEVSATMVTMVFALPPLIRLTNLGIRQVPSEIVEAARAYGASNYRVLFDVQIPLARRTIMAGLNQTLLLAISMLGIAAIMGAGGLGRLLFQAINNQDLARAASAGLAFFLVAVVLDRVSQRTDSDPKNFVVRIREAWAHRRHPEQLLASSSARDVPSTQPKTIMGFAAPIAGKEHLPMLVAIIGGILAVGGTLLPWTSNAGKMSAYGRLSDASLEGQFDGMNFIGISASGGSWFGIAVLVLGVFVVLAVALSFFSDRIPRWFAADGAVISALAAFVLTLAHLLARPYEPGMDLEAADPGTGFGVFVALAGAALASAGAIWWMRVGQYAPIRPLKVSISWGRLVSVAAAMVLLVIAMYSGWSFDQRQELTVSPEIQAQIDDLEQQLEEPDANTAALSLELLLLRSRTSATEVATDGVSELGPQLGLWAFVFGIVALFAAVPAVGLYGTSDRLLWYWNSVMAGLGGGVSLIGLAWIFTHVRTADTDFTTGVGAFLAVIAGVLILGAALPVLNVVRRTKKYSTALAEDSKSSAEQAR